MRRNKIFVVILFVAKISIVDLMAQTQLEVAHWWTSPSEAKAIAVIKNAFEEIGYKWVDSSVIGGGGDPMKEKLRTRVAIGNPPHIVQMHMGHNLWKWAEEDVLLNLNDVAKKENWDELLPPIVKKMVQYQGNYMGVPVNAHRVNWMWVNPEIFRKANAQIPTTWEEFLVSAEKIQKAGFIPVAMGKGAWQEAVLFETILIGMGGLDFHKKTLIELDIKAIKSPTMVKVFDLMGKIRLYTDKGRNSRTWDAATTMVVDGKAAMQFMGDWAKGELSAMGKKTEKDFKCLPTPETHGIFLLSADIFAMFKVQDKTIEAAQKTFARILMEPEIQERFNIYKGSTSMRSGVDPKNFDACGQASMEAFKQSVDNKTLVPAFSFGLATPPEARKEMMNLISKHFNSDMSAELAAKKLSAIVKLVK